jgi:hypothetical protein
MLGNFFFGVICFQIQPFFFVEGEWRGEAYHGGLFWLAIWSQNYILAIKNVKIKCMCKILKSYNFTQLLGKH